MQVSFGEAPKVASIDFEANLYASLLGLLAPFALEEWRRRRGATEAIVAAFVILALGLGVTRGAYAGLLAGLVVYLGLLFVRKVPRGALVRVAGLAAVACLLAPVTAWVLLPAGRSNPGPTPTLIAGASQAPTPSPGPSPSPSPSPTPQADTLAWRLDRIPAAVSDIETSPLIGLGAAAFGQRHPRADAPETPDYIGTQALVAVYEAGVLGAAALGLGFLILLMMLARRSSSDVGRCAAYAGAICSFLVSYQVTNALWFSINWLVIGAALALVASSRVARPPLGTPPTRP
jgi:energy-coupling factor transporter transmembrane protein EcfT